MKNLLWGLFAFATLAHAQGTVTDIDGNTYDYLTYGTQQWTVENAAMETYRDGTPIPQVTDATQWASLTTGAWCYYDNDPTKGKLYNWYAVVGIHDNDPNTPNKEFAPAGWHVPTDAEWTILEEYLIANGYNYDGTTTGNKIAKSMASTSDWNNSTNLGAVGNNQNQNNSSAFNAIPDDDRLSNGIFDDDNFDATFWSSSSNGIEESWYRVLNNGWNYLGRLSRNIQSGYSVRLIKDNNNCSEVSINASSTNICAGESVDLGVDGLNSSTGVNTQSHSFTTGNYTRIPYTPHLYNLPQSTIEFWYYQESSSEEFIVATEYFNTGWGFHVENNGGSPRFLEWRVSDGAARLGFDIPDRYEIPFNQWIHVAGVHDGSTVYLYVDGNLIDSAPYTGQIGDSYEDIVINRHTWASGSSERLNGKIDELRISNIARYTSDFTPPLYEFSNDSNTLALWHFNGNMQDESQYNTQSVTNGTNFSSNVPFGSYNFNSTDLLWSTGDTTENITVTPIETTEYWVDVTTNGVTCREYVSINVTAPAAPTGDAEQTFCEASTIADLTATGENIQWYDAATGGNLLNSTTVLTDGQMVYATQTVNGCESTERLEVSVSIQDITITASATEVCAGESVDLTVSSCTSADLPANLQTGLVGYWPFCGNANDESGNGNNGTVNGATLTTDRFGNQDSAYIFEINDSFINIGSDNLLQFSNDFSYSVKFLVNEITLGSDCTAGSNIILNNEGLYEIGVDCNGILSFAIANDDPSWSWIPITPILINQWYDVTFTYNQGVIEIFMDGDLIYNYNGSGGLTDFHPNLNDLRLGDRQLHDVLNVQTSSFNGKIDDVVLWNRALTPSETQQITSYSTYTWSTGDTTANISVTPTETTEYWVDVTTNGVTCREYVTINVTAPAAPTGDAEQTFCDAATVSDLTSTGENTQWYDAASGGNLLDSTTVLIDGQMVYASQTVNGCESTDRLEVTVSIQDITITASATEVCAGESVDLGVTYPQQFNSWTHMVAVYNLDTDLLYFYINGVLRATSDISGIGNIFLTGGGSGSRKIGARAYSNQPDIYFWGDIDDVGVWDKPLSNIQVTDLYENQNICQVSDLPIELQSNLIAYYPFCNSLVDIGGGHNGTNFGVTASTDRFGNENSSFHFDGTSYVSIPTSLNLNNTSGGWTLSAWANPDFIANNIPNANYILDLTDGTGNNNWGDRTVLGLVEDGYRTGCHADNNISASYGVTAPFSTPPSILWSTGDTTANISVTPTETTEYWVDVTTNGVTCREYVTINVTAPAAPTGPLTQAYCNAATVADLTAIGENIQWYDAAIGGNLLDSSTSLIDGQMVYASHTVNGCESTDRLEVRVSIQDITITASATEVCAGEEVTLNVNNLNTVPASSCYGSTNQIFSDWTELAPNAEYVNIIKHNNIYYLRSNNDVLQSSNINGSWVSMNFQNQIGHQCSPIATLFDFDWADRLQVATLHNSLYAYENGNWINNGLSGYGCSGRALTRLANNRIIVSKWGYLRDLYISDDNGSNWTNVTNVDNDYRDIIVADNGTVFACGGSNTASMTGLIKSTDNGNSFFNISSELGINYASTLSDDCEGNLYVVADNSIYKSIDEGENWTLFSNTPFNSTISYSFLLPISSDVLFLFGRNTNEVGLYESNNGGATWQELTNPLSDLNTIREFKLIDNVLVILSDEGVFGKTIEFSTSTFVWSTGDTTETISVTPTETTEYWVDVTTNGVTCREYVTINVTAPAAPIGLLTQAFCDVATVADLTATGNNILWYDAATGGNLLDSITALTDGQTVYASQTVNGCESTDRLEVTVSIQDITITASATEVCAGESVDLSVVGDINSTYLWSTGESNFSGQGTLIDEYSLIANTVSQNTFSTIPGNIYRLEVSGTISLGGGAGNQRDVAYYIQSGSDGTIEGTPFDSACNLRIWTSLFCDTPGLRPSPDIYDASTHTYNYPFNANSSTLDVGFWDSPLSDNGPNVVTFKLYELSNSESTITVSPTETTEYWVDVTTNGVTCREYVTISVNDLPEAPTGESVNYFINCDSFSPTLDDAIATLTGENIKLYDAAVGGNLLDPNSNIIDGQVVYASQTLDSCESSDRLEVQLNLYTLEMPVTDAPDNTVSFCNEQNLTILDLAPAQTATDRLWYETATSTTPIAETTPLVDGVTYYVSNHDIETGCESDRLAMTVEINNPEAPTGDAVQSFCDNVTVSDLLATGSNIQWYDAATGGNVLDPSSALSDGQLLYASQTQNGCESITRLEVNVEIDIIPDPILITTELEFCLAREATLADLEVDEQGFALEWYDSFSGGNMLPMDTLLEDGVSYYATLYDAVSGCESLMRLEVVPTVIPCEVVIYNAISLNDNGMNDYMVIENAEYFPDNSLEVYNRDGHLLYSQTQYGIGGNLFRGKANVSGIYNKNSNLPTGSYLYVFKYFNPYEQQEYRLKGFLTINSN